MKRQTFLYCILLFCCEQVLALGENENLEDFIAMVEDFIEDTESYIIPKDNLELLALDNIKPIDYGTFDFIVVGSGAGGGVVANRLSEIHGWNVLVLEAGAEPVDVLKMTALYTYYTFTEFNWGDNSTTQKYAALGSYDQKVYLPRGKALGGTTSINGMVVTRGNPKDYDTWARECNCTGWSYKDNLPYFKKIENAIFEPQDKGFHGESGLFIVNKTTDINYFTPIATSAFRELGYEPVDINGRKQIGFSNMQYAIKGNERQSTYYQYLLPFYDRPNLKVSANSFVTRVLIDKKTKTALGVEFVKNGVKYHARASKEVILSAGVFNSAQILMLSGVGPRQHLEKLGIEVIEDRPVGQSLVDHVLYFGVQIRLGEIVNNLTFEEELKLYVAHQEPLLTPGKFIVYSNMGNTSDEQPLIEYIFNVPQFTGDALAFCMGFTEDYANVYDVDSTTDVYSGIILLHPKSKGQLTLVSSNPVHKPVINPNYLAEIDDVETLYQAIQHLLKLNDSEAFTRTGSQVMVFDSPYCSEYELYSKEWWYCDIRSYSGSAWHSMSTNRMGPAKRSDTVVSPSLKVHGINNLRVVDSSIFPGTVSGHTMIPTMMVAEKASDIIKKEYNI